MNDDEEILKIAETLYNLRKDTEAQAFKTKYGGYEQKRSTWDYMVRNYPCELEGWKALARLFVAVRDGQS